MKTFFASYLRPGAVTPFDSEEHPGAQMVRDKFRGGGPNDWQGTGNKRNAWGSPWGGRFEWHWRYFPEAGAGCLTVYREAGSEDVVAMAFVLPGAEPEAERRLLGSAGVPAAATAADRPLVLYVPGPIRLVSEPGSKGGQPRLECGRDPGGDVRAFFSYLACAFGGAFLTRQPQGGPP
jgi:hypothetical protein